MTRRRVMAAGGVLAGGLAATGLLANTAVAAAGATAPVTTKTISLDQAHRIVQAAIQYTKEHSLPPMYVLVVDGVGQPTASARMDGNALASLDLVPAKAYTACRFGTATADLAAGVKDPGQIAALTAGGMSLLPGGRPIVQDGVVIGAIGAGGSINPAVDDQVAIAALKAL
ncbi:MULTISPECIES: heme-binding protein [Streptacidiphilus]|uniref:Heme-binding protein n=2 Tax=Streptacidiphilus TaxID=228398 RepID=A0ABV6V0S2_9ACTN|nr:heme-binding protein [Streptacidiphilus jeojiense]